MSGPRTTRVTRRSALALTAAAISAPALALAADRAERRFTILRDGADIGTHRVALIREGGDLRAEIDIRIVVRVLGIAAYRYEMTNRETWRDGLLIRIDSSVNDDGRRKRVAATRDGAGELRVEGSLYTGAAPADAATTSYFTDAFLKRGTWISTDGGELYDVGVATLGETQVRTKRGQAFARSYRAKAAPDFDVKLFYDERGEWAGCEFDAGGETARYVADSLDSRLSDVWNG